MEDPDTQVNMAGRTQSLYRKYRPETFAEDEFVGQDHVRRTLKNAIAQDRVSHAYLFCGPRGTGKTTTARLLAKAVNCEDPDPNNRPCNVCESCRAINEGRATDIVEIDAASNRGIEDIRDLRDQVRYAPTQLRHKFYIIDEAHRLTRDAFNAFLKTLEEPPPNTTFVLATTDPDQLLETVASRCQRFDFHRIPVDKMMQRMRDVCQAEGIEIDDDALLVVVRHATGSLRDAQSLVDTLRTAVEGQGDRIDLELTRQMLGLSQDERTLAVIEAIGKQDVAAGLGTIGEVVDSGQDVRAFGRQLVSALRLMMLVKAGVAPEEAGPEIQELADQFDLTDLVHINQQFSEIDYAMRTGGFAQLPLELAFLSSIYGDPSSAVQLQPMPQRQATPERRAAAPAKSARNEQAQHSPDPAPQPVEPEPAPVAAKPKQPAPEVREAGGEVFGEIVDRWQEIRTEVKALDRKTEALLASTDPGSLTDNTLILVAAYPFHASKLNDDSARRTIEESLERVIGARLQVMTVLKDEFDASGPPPSPPSNSTPASGQQSNGARPSTPSKQQAEPAMESRRDDSQERVVDRLKALFDADEIDPAELPPGLSIS